MRPNGSTTLYGCLTTNCYDTTDGIKENIYKGPPISISKDCNLKEETYAT